MDDMIPAETLFPCWRPTGYSSLNHPAETEVTDD